MIRDKIKEIEDNVDKFKLKYFIERNSYRNYRFVFKSVEIKISTYSFPFGDEVKLCLQDEEIFLKTKEEKFLLKTFKEKRRAWKKENSNITHFDSEEEKRQNCLLNSINFEEEEL